MGSHEKVEKYPGTPSHGQLTGTKNITDVWMEYKKTKSEHLRNILMENYLHLVRYQAERMLVKLPDEVELDDLISAGIFGLIDAINVFDTDRAIKFETYSAPRIRGAILDELRAMDWVPRLVRRRTHQIQDASKQLEIDLGRQPTRDELIKHLKVTDQQFVLIQNDSHAVGTVSLSHKSFDSNGTKELRDEPYLFKDKKAVDPSIAAYREDLKHIITQCLSRQERLIIVLYYYEEKTMFEIGELLDMSESRVSQIHTSILSRLKARNTLREIYKHIRQATA